MSMLRTLAVTAVAVGILMCVVVLSAGPAAYAGGTHGTPDPNATPIVGGGHDGHTPTYYGDVEPILTQNCMGCHVEGGIGYVAFEMDDVDTITEPDNADYIAFVTGIEYMPPWPPGDESLPFLHDRTLTDDEIMTIAAWAEAGAPLGDESERQDGIVSDVPTIRSDAVLTMPEPYTPDGSTIDDYRCFLLETEFETDQYLTGYTIDPGADAIVHHVIVFQLDSSTRDAAIALDAESDAPGWECYGGPGLPFGGSSDLQQNLDFATLNSALAKQNYSLAQLIETVEAAGLELNASSAQAVFQLLSEEGVDIEQLLNDLNIDLASMMATSGGGAAGMGWVPGVVPTEYNNGIGRFIGKDSVLVMQVHYNLSAPPETDQTSLIMQLEPYSEDIVPIDGQVFLAPVEIPCPEDATGEACDRAVVAAEAETVIGNALLPLCNQDLSVYADNTAENAYGYCDYELSGDGWIVEVLAHMHERGTESRITLNPGTPEETTILHIPDWDFHWQGSYQLAEPLAVSPGDTIRVECWWDNSRGDRYIVWGEGTQDEMCFNTMQFIWNPDGSLTIDDISDTNIALDDHTGDHAHDDTSHDHSSHDHDALLEVGGDVLAPAVQLMVMPDPIGGYNVHMTTTNFTFAPQAAGYDHVPGEGHAHLYVNGEKIARVYGEWYHIDSLPSGTHTITATLNSNNHQPLAVNGVALEASTVITVE